MDNNRSKRRWSGRGIVLFSVFCYVLFTALPGCSPKIIEKAVVQRDTTTVHHRDSIFTKDSIYIKEWMKGDTVYIDRYRDRYIYKDKWRDSISIREVHDTTTVEKKVERELTAGQKAKIGLFWWLIAGLAGCLVWIFRKPILTFIKTLI